MTPKQFERMAKCDHRKTCGRLVTLKASSYADPYYWCLCDECPHYSTENAKLRKLVRLMWLACKSKGIIGGDYVYPYRNSNADERVLFEPLLRELGIDVKS